MMLVRKCPADGDRIIQSKEYIVYNPGQSRPIQANVFLRNFRCKLHRWANWTCFSGIFDANWNYFSNRLTVVAIKSQIKMATTISLSCIGPTSVFYVERTNTTGTPETDERFPQNVWNVDPLDGSSGLILPPFDKSITMVIHISWPTYDRLGFMIDGKLAICHQFSTEVHFSRTPSIPIRNLEIWCCCFRSHMTEGSTFVYGI